MATLKELREKAKALNIKGRSKMDSVQLQLAIWKQQDIQIANQLEAASITYFITGKNYTATSTDGKLSFPIEIEQRSSIDILPFSIKVTGADGHSGYTIMDCKISIVDGIEQGEFTTTHPTAHQEARFLITAASKPVATQESAPSEPQTQAQPEASAQQTPAQQETSAPAQETTEQQEQANQNIPAFFAHFVGFTTEEIATYFQSFKMLHLKNIALQLIIPSYSSMRKNEIAHAIASKITDILRELQASQPIIETVDYNTQQNDNHCNPETSSRMEHLEHLRNNPRTPRHLTTTRFIVGETYNGITQNGNIIPLKITARTHNALTVENVYNVLSDPHSDITSDLGVEQAIFYMDNYAWIKISADNPLQKSSPAPVISTDTQEVSEPETTTQPVPSRDILEAKCMEVYNCTNPEDMRAILDCLNTATLAAMCRIVNAFVSKNPTKSGCIEAFIAEATAHKSRQSAHSTPQASAVQEAKPETPIQSITTIPEYATLHNGKIDITGMSLTPEELELHHRTSFTVSKFEAKYRVVANSAEKTFRFFSDGSKKPLCAYDIKTDKFTLLDDYDSRSPENMTLVERVFRQRITEFFSLPSQAEIQNADKFSVGSGKNKRTYHITTRRLASPYLERLYGFLIDVYNSDNEITAVYSPFWHEDFVFNAKYPINTSTKSAIEKAFMKKLPLFLKRSDLSDDNGRILSDGNEDLRNAVDEWCNTWGHTIGNFPISEYDRKHQHELVQECNTNSEAIPDYDAAFDEAAYSPDVQDVSVIVDDIPADHEPDIAPVSEPETQPASNLEREPWQKHTCDHCDGTPAAWTHEQFIKGILLFYECNKLDHSHKFHLDPMIPVVFGLTDYLKYSHSLVQLWNLARFFGLNIPKIDLTDKTHKTERKKHQIASIIGEEIGFMEHVYICTYENPGAPELPAELAEHIPEWRKEAIVRKSALKPATRKTRHTKKIDDSRQLLICFDDNNTPVPTSTPAKPKTCRVSRPRIKRDYTRQLLINFGENVADGQTDQRIAA